MGQVKNNKAVIFILNNWKCGWKKRFRTTTFTSLLFLISIVILLTACGNSDIITVYSLKKVNPKKNYGHKWLPLSRTTYRIKNNIVVSDTGGMLAKYENCIIMSPDNWECHYVDGSGSFGFRDGEFWRMPEWDDIKTVSSFEYNRVRCEWALEDKDEGIFWGIVRCILGWH